MMNIMLQANNKKFYILLTAILLFEFIVSFTLAESVSSIPAPSSMPVYSRSFTLWNINFGSPACSDFSGCRFIVQDNGLCQYSCNKKEPLNIDVNALEEVKFVSSQSNELAAVNSASCYSSAISNLCPEGFAVREATHFGNKCVGVCSKTKIRELCSDYTIKGLCSTNKPLFCNKADNVLQLADNCAKCGCSSGKVCTEDGSCIGVCSDGTREGQCSANTPSMKCTAGAGGYALSPSCNACGCPPGQECNKETNQCYDVNSYIVELKSPSLAEKAIETRQTDTYARNIVSGRVADAKAVEQNALKDAGSTIDAEQTAFLNELGVSNSITGNAVTGYAVAASQQPKIISTYKNIMNGFAMKMTPEEAERIKQSKYVKEVYRDIKVQGISTDKSKLLDDKNKATNLITGNAVTVTGRTLTGKGITIAVIDSGIDYTHPDLAHAYIGGYDFVNNDANPLDDRGHGTHVAGIIVSKSIVIVSTNRGIAQDAKILAYKVIDQNGYSYASYIISAIERALDPDQDGDLSDHADIISMSLELHNSKNNAQWSGPDGLLSRKADDAVRAGVIVVVAAGNCGPGAIDMCWLPGIPSDRSSIGSPGTSRLAITIGSATEDKTRVSGFSSRGPVLDMIKPDIVAVGERVPSTVPIGPTGSCSLCNPNGYALASGTSMATPYVAGLAALILEAHPEFGTGDVKVALRSSAKWLSGFTANDQGSGVVTADQLAAYLATVDSVRCTDHDLNIDAGLAYTTKSYVERQVGRAGGYVAVADRCLDGATLIEQYCDTANNIYESRVTCQGGCSDGACGMLQDSCTDTDPNQNIYTMGRVRSVKNGAVTEDTDRCKRDSTNILSEAYCAADGTIAYVEKSCPAGYSCRDPPTDFKICSKIL